MKHGLVKLGQQYVDRFNDNDDPYEFYRMPWKKSHPMFQCLVG